MSSYPKWIVRLVGEREDSNRARKKHESEESGEHADEEGEDVAHEVPGGAFDQHRVLNVFLILDNWGIDNEKNKIKTNIHFVFIIKINIPISL